MDTVICESCVGYGETYENLGSDDNPNYMLRSCHACRGLCHAPMGGYRAESLPKTDRKTLFLKIEKAIEDHNKRLKAWLSKPLAERQRIYQEIRAKHALWKKEKQEV